MLLTLAHGLVVVVCSVLTFVAGISDDGLKALNHDLVEALVERIRVDAGDVNTLSISKKVKIQSSKGGQTKDLKNLRLRFDKDKLLTPELEDTPILFPNAILMATDGSTELEFPAARFNVEVKCKATEKLGLDYSSPVGGPDGRFGVSIIFPIDYVDEFKTSIAVDIGPREKNWNGRIQDWNNQNYGGLDESALKKEIVKQTIAFIKKLVNGLPKTILCRKVTDKSN